VTGEQPLGTLFPPNPEYDYFRAPGFPRATASYDPVNASWLADAALLAYGGEALATARFGASLHPKSFPGASALGYVAHGADFAIVTFRGTEVLSPAANRPFGDAVLGVAADLLTDADFKLERIGDGRHAHRGIVHALDQVWGAVEAHLRTLRTQGVRTFWFTGHSLGAAMATLAADRFEHATALYTFGSPFVGDAAFRDRFRVPAYRIVHGSDPITRIAPAAPYAELHVPPIERLAHVGTLHQLGEVRSNAATLGDVAAAIVQGIGASPVDAVREAVRAFLRDTPALALDDHAPIHYATLLRQAATS